MSALVVIEICAGTTCFIWGGSALLTLEDQLPEAWKERVIIRGTPCLDVCKKGDLKPPFVTINGTVHANMDTLRLLELITRTLEDYHAF